MEQAYRREPLVAGRADYAKGNRFLHRTELGRMPLIRRYGNIALTFLAKCASGNWSMFDPSNGFTALHGKAWSAMNEQRIGCRYFFETSMLIEVGRIRGVVEDRCTTAHGLDPRAGAPGGPVHCTWHTGLAEASILIERWRREYNEFRPHSSLAYRPPAPEAMLPRPASFSTLQQPAWALGLT